MGALLAGLWLKRGESECQPPSRHWASYEGTESAWLWFVQSPLQALQVLTCHCAEAHPSTGWLFSCAAGAEQHWGCPVDLLYACPVESVVSAWGYFF